MSFRTKIKFEKIISSQTEGPNIPSETSFIWPSHKVQGHCGKGSRKTTRARRVVSSVLWTCHGHCTYDLTAAMNTVLGPNQSITSIGREGATKLSWSQRQFSFWGRGNNFGWFYCWQAALSHACSTDGTHYVIGKRAWRQEEQVLVCSETKQGRNLGCVRSGYTV